MAQPPQAPNPNMYGYNPMNPPPQFRYPKGYWIMPDVYGSPIEEIPPAQGNLLQAWFSIGVRITRKNIARWANVDQPSWTPISLLVAFAAPIIGLIIFGLMIFQIVYNQYIQSMQSSVSSGGPTLQANLAHSLLTVELIAVFIMFIVQTIAGFFIFVLYTAGAADKNLGTFMVRYRRAIRPIALAYASIGIMVCFMAIVYGIGITIMSNSAVLSVFSKFGYSYNFTMIVALIAYLLLVILPVDVFIPVYTYALMAQSGNVATGVNRWGVFALYIAASFTAGICSLPVAGLVSVIVMTMIMK